MVFTGYVSPEDLLRYYHTCDVFCAPSTGQESFGIVLLEAMAAGKPIVASGIPGYQEVVRHGQEGLLVEPRDEVALALDLVHVLADELRERLAAHGQRRAAQFSWDASPAACSRLDEHGARAVAVSCRAAPAPPAYATRGRLGRPPPGALDRGGPASVPGKPAACRQRARAAVLVLARGLCAPA